MQQTANIVFFGTPDFSVIILEHLKKANLLPSLIVTAPDKKIGRKQVLTSPAVKIWAQKHNIELVQPDHPREIVSRLQETQADLFVVAAYGYIISQKILDIPKYGTLNVHTSLLPRYRGACPIESAILHGDEQTGSSIMLMDAKMDHGPIIKQESFLLDPDTNRVELFETLAHHGGNLLIRTIPRWIQGEIEAQEQDHSKASFCYKIDKADGDVSNDSDEIRYRKYLAYFGWPGIFYFDEQRKRIKITKARYENKTFIIERVVPEGKNEMDFERYISK